MVDGSTNLQGDLLAKVRSLPPLSKPLVPKPGDAGAAPVAGGSEVASPTATPTLPAAAAADPGDLPREAYADMPWSEVGSKALSNLLPSTGSALKGMYDAVVNYEDTASTLGQLGKGVASKVRGAFGGERNMEAEALADAIGEHYSGVYGSKAGFKEALAEDPASIMLDAASVAPVVGAAGRAAGLGKLATGVEKVVSLGDPLYLAGKTAGIASKAITKPTAAASRYVQGAASGTPQSMLKLAQEAGKSGTPAQRNAFLTFATGKGDNRDIAKVAMDAVEELKKATSADYVARRSALSTQELPMTEIRNAIQKVEQSLGGNARALFPDVHAALQEMKNRVQLVEMSPNPMDRSAVGLDLLKRSLADVSEGMRNSGHYGALSEVPRATRNTIAAFDGNYADMMDRWQKWRNELLDFQRTLGTTDRAAESARLAKLLSTAKKEDKMSLLKQLASQTQSGQLLPFMIAGATVEKIAPPYLQGMGLMGLGSLAAGGPHGAAVAAAASPRLAGLTQYGLGRVEGAINAVPKVPAIASNALSQIGQQANGGRVERRAGGRVGISHEKLADQLVTAAERAKKGISKGTEQLLELPDDHIAHALEVANRSI